MLLNFATKKPGCYTGLCDTKRKELKEALKLKKSRKIPA